MVVRVEEVAAAAATATVWVLAVLSVATSRGFFLSSPPILKAGFVMKDPVSLNVRLPESLRSPSLLDSTLLSLFLNCAFFCDSSVFMARPPSAATEAAAATASESPLWMLALGLLRLSCTNFPPERFPSSTCEEFLTRLPILSGRLSCLLGMDHALRSFPAGFVLTTSLVLAPVTAPPASNTEVLAALTVLTALAALSLRPPRKLNDETHECRGELVRFS